MSDLRPSCFWGRITWTEWESVLGIGWLIIHIARATFATFFTCGDKTICNSYKHINIKLISKEKSILKFCYLVWQVRRIAHNFFTLGGFSFWRYPKDLSVLIELYLSVPLSASVPNKVGKKLLLDQCLIFVQATQNFIKKVFWAYCIYKLDIGFTCESTPAIFWWYSNENQRSCVEMIPE